MNVTDSPHRPGTPEHGAWVRDVYIPAMRIELSKADAARAGAESIGARLIDGRRIKVLIDIHASDRDLRRLFIDAQRVKT